MERPIVVCGFGRMGSHVLEYLRAGGLPVVVIDNVARPDDPRLTGVRFVPGDCRRREVLEAAGVERARGVLVLTHDDLINVSTALMVRSLAPEVRIVVRMFNQNLLGRLGKAVKNVYALSISLLTAPVLAVTAVTGQGLGAFRLEGRADSARQVAEVPIVPGGPTVGRTIGEVVAPREAIAIAHLREGKKDFLLDIDLEAPLEAADRLILCAEPRSIASLLAAQAEEEPVEARFAGWLRRMWRVVGGTFQEFDRPLFWATIVLLVTVFVSTLILWLGVTRYHLPMAFLRAVSVLATGAGLNEQEYPDAPGVQVFVSTLRIVGAVLMAAFTAIATNYLLRARLVGAFEAHRIPDSGHVVICGLSTIGFRALEELQQLGQRVVVVEIDPTNRFLTTARRAGVPVIVGDATVMEVLRQAHTSTALAVLATTNNDMINLEVVLLARELAPELRVIPLLNEPQFAQMLREEANVRLALSVPVLATPAFVAGLFGDRVVSVFLVGERLFAVLDLLVAEGDPFAGHAVRALAVDYRVQPVLVARADGSTPRPMLAARLEAGDRLVGIIDLRDLERLLRRQPSSAEWAVEVSAFHLPTRGWLAGLVRTISGVGAEEAEATLEHLPLRLASNLTRGQAEDLLAQLVRERVTARLERLA